MVRPPEPSPQQLGQLPRVLVLDRGQVAALRAAHDAQVLIEEEVPVQRTAASLCVKLH